MSTETRMSALYVALALVVFAAGAAAITFGMKTHTITRTHTIRVEKSWGRPDGSVPGAQVNQGLAGLTCDVYRARKTVVCHP